MTGGGGLADAGAGVVVELVWLLLVLFVLFVLDDFDFSVVPLATMALELELAPVLFELGELFVLLLGELLLGELLLLLFVLLLFPLAASIICTSPS